MKLIDGRPALYLSNFSSAHSKGRHGPGLVYTIMVAPRRWEHGEGKVLPLMHDPAVFFAANNGEITFDELRRRFELKLTEGATSLTPGHSPRRQGRSSAAAAPKARHASSPATRCAAAAPRATPAIGAGRRPTCIKPDGPWCSMVSYGGQHERPQA